MAMLRSATLLAGLVLAAGKLRMLDLEASEGETAGKYAFPGGNHEATCKACAAVMAHVERELAKPFANEFMGPSRREAKKDKSAKAKELNDAAHVSAVLDPTSCSEAMKKCVRPHRCASPRPHAPRLASPTHTLCAAAGPPPGRARPTARSAAGSDSGTTSRT